MELFLPTMTYGCQMWSLTKATTQRLRTAQRAMERKMLKAKLKDKIPCREIRAKTNIKDVVKFAAKQKWKWAGHVARLNDNRWTKRITDWQPRYGKRSRGRQVKRWRDRYNGIKKRKQASFPFFLYSGNRCAHFFLHLLNLDNRRQSDLRDQYALTLSWH